MLLHALDTSLMRRDGCSAVYEIVATGYMLKAGHLMT
jgi:hypothetical protein